MYTLAIKKFRNMRHLTLEQLSDLCGISPSHLSRLEADNTIRTKTTTLLQLEAISLALCVCPKDIIFYSCSNCRLYDTCEKKDEVNYEDILEEKLEFYI